MGILVSPKHLETWVVEEKRRRKFRSERLRSVSKFAGARPIVIIVQCANCGGVKGISYLWCEVKIVKRKK